jgi:3-phosphoshikimate 1-carboxyvinyltransferase
VNQLRLEPIQSVSGTVHLPGSKSLSNRALLLAALSEGETHLTNLLDGDDVRHMLAALKRLGVNYRLSEDKTQCWVTGCAGHFPFQQGLTLFLGNAGTAMRPLAAVLAAIPGDVTLTGEPRMEERPIGALVDAMEQAGAEINYLKQPGYPPLKVSGNWLLGGDIEVDGSVSSQFLTGILMAAPLFEEGCKIQIKGELVSKPYIDITLKVMAQFGVKVEHADYRQFSIAAGQHYRSPGHFLVEGDASSASYFLAAAAIAGGKVKVVGIGCNSIQGDIRFAEVLQKMGARIQWGEDFIQVERNSLKGIDMDMNHIPDAAMTIATTALFAKGDTRIRNIYNWRVKETDRLAAMATELRKVGANVTEGSDYIVISPPKSLLEAQIDTYDDHRMAMCFSLVALSNTPVIINDPECTVKTFPDYFQRLAAISHYQ